MKDGGGEPGRLSGFEPPPLIEAAASDPALTGSSEESVSWTELNWGSAPDPGILEAWLRCSKGEEM